MYPAPSLSNPCCETGIPGDGATPLGTRKGRRIVIKVIPLNSYLVSAQFEIIAEAGHTRDAIIDAVSRGILKWRIFPSVFVDDEKPGVWSVNNPGEVVVLLEGFGKAINLMAPAMKEKK